MHLWYNKILCVYIILVKFLVEKIERMFYNGDEEVIIRIDTL